jgi:hypothetical protein
VSAGRRHLCTLIQLPDSWLRAFVSQRLGPARAWLRGLLTHGGVPTRVMDCCGHRVQMMALYGRCPAE